MKPLFAADFESDPTAAGWQPMSRMSTEGLRWAASDGGHCLAVVHETEKLDGGWESPRFPVKDLQDYRLRFRARLTGEALWAVFFYDAEGKLIEGDHYDGLDPSEGWVEHDFCVKTKFPGVTASVAFRLCKQGALYVDDVSVAPASRQEVQAWSDALYAGMPPIHWVPSPDACRALPRTMKKLREGGPLRIVLLGDSIACDLSNSPFDALLERTFPKARVEVRFTGRGGTGWSYYQEHVQERVIDHRPDLVMLLAISNKLDALGAPLQRILDETHAALPETEFLLVSPHLAQWGDPVPELAPAHRDALWAAARRVGGEVLDLTAAWNDYVATCGHPQSWLMRDHVHMNTRGRQLAARVVASYLAAGRGR